MGKEKNENRPKSHQSTRRSAGALSRASNINVYHIDFTCYDKFATRRAYRPTPLRFRLPSVPQQSPPCSHLSNRDQLSEPPLRVGHREATASPGLRDARASPASLRENRIPPSGNRSPATLDPSKAQRGLGRASATERGRALRAATTSGNDPGGERQAAGDRQPDGWRDTF